MGIVTSWSVEEEVAHQSYSGSVTWELTGQCFLYEAVQILVAVPGLLASLQQ